MVPPAVLIFLTICMLYSFVGYSDGECLSTSLTCSGDHQQEDSSMTLYTLYCAVASVDQLMLSKLF